MEERRERVFFKCTSFRGNVPAGYAGMFGRMRRIYQFTGYRKGYHNMKVILLQDDKKLGKKGDVVEVSEGYARNFILPKKLGVEATPKNLNDLKLQKAHDDKVAREQLEAAKALAAALEEKQVIVKIKAGEGGRAFGSVSSKEIAAACREQHNIELDKKKIQLPESLKSFGSYEVAVKMHPQVTGKLIVKVAEA